MLPHDRLSAMLMLSLITDLILGRSYGRTLQEMPDDLIIASIFDDDDYMPDAMVVTFND